MTRFPTFVFLNCFFPFFFFAGRPVPLQPWRLHPRPPLSRPAPLQQQQAAAATLPALRQQLQELRQHPGRRSLRAAAATTAVQPLRKSFAREAAKEVRKAHLTKKYIFFIKCQIACRTAGTSLGRSLSSSTAGKPPLPSHYAPRVLLNNSLDGDEEDFVASR